MKRCQGMLVLLALGVAVIGAPRSGAQPPEPLPAALLQLTLALDQEVYVPGEPVVAYLAITNSGDRPVAVESCLDPELAPVHYLVTGPAGKEERFAPLMMADAIIPRLELGPGESVYGDALLHYGAAGWTFAEAGTYQVRAAYRGRRFVSDPVTLEVSEPSSSLETEHGRLVLGEPEVGRFMIFEEGDHLKEARAVLGELSESEESSVHRRYAAYMLGTALSKSFADFGVGRLRPADRPRANRYLESVRDELPSFYFTAKAYLLLALNHSRLGEEETAGEVVTELGRVIEKRFPERRPWLSLVRDRVERRYATRKEASP